MKYPQTQTPMTTNFDSYMDLKRFEGEGLGYALESSDLERRRTKISETFEFIKKKFGRRKTVSYNH